MTTSVRSLLEVLRAGGLAAGLALCGGLIVSGCTGPDKTLLIHEPEPTAAAAIWQAAFVREITIPDNYRYHTEERAAIAADPARGLLYVGSRDGTLLALDDRLGELEWEVDVSGGISNRPVLVRVDLDQPSVRPASPDERPDWLLFGTDDGALVALDLETREVRWRYRTAGVIHNAAVPGEGVVHFVNSRDQVYTVDVRDGEWVWEYAGAYQKDFTVHGRAGLAYVPAALADIGRGGVIYTGFADGRVVALDAAGGAVLWNEPLAPGDVATFIDVDTTPLLRLDRGELIVANQTSGVFSLSLSEGSRRWNRQIRGVGSLVDGPGGLILATSSLEGVFGLEYDGRIRWRQQLDTGAVAAPLVVGNTIVLAHSDIGLLALAAGDGEVLARLDNGSGSSATPVFDPVLGRIYSTSDRGQLYALELLQP